MHRRERRLAARLLVHRGIPGSRGAPDVCRATHRRGGFARIAARSARPDPGRRTATPTDRDTHRRQQQQKKPIAGFGGLQDEPQKRLPLPLPFTPQSCESCNRFFCCCCRRWYAVVLARVASVAGGSGEMLAVTICVPRSRNSAMNPTSSTDGTSSAPRRFGGRGVVGNHGAVRRGDLPHGTHQRIDHTLTRSYDPGTLWPVSLPPMRRAERETTGR